MQTRRCLPLIVHLLAISLFLFLLSQSTCWGSGHNCRIIWNQNMNSSLHPGILTPSVNHTGWTDGWVTEDKTVSCSQSVIQEKSMQCSSSKVYKQLLCKILVSVITIGLGVLWSSRALDPSTPSSFFYGNKNILQWVPQIPFVSWKQSSCYISVRF
jgi:hypothetical protein